MSYQLSSAMGEKVFILIEKIMKIINEEYGNVVKQINTMMHDISRYIVISNIQSDVFDLMKESEDFIFQAIENPQKQLVMKQKTEILDTLDHFLEYFYDELWEFFEKIREELEKQQLKINNTEERFWYEFIVSNISMLTGLIKSVNQHREYKKFTKKRY